MTKLQAKFAQFEKEKYELSANLKQATEAGGVEHAKMEGIRMQNEEVARKVKELKKRFKGHAKEITEKATKIEGEVEKKADRDMVIENQKNFFQNLSRMENESDNQMVGVINQELKKLSDQVKTETT